MADCEYQIGGQGKFYSESEFKKLLSEGYLDKVMLEKQIKIRGIKADEAIASSFQLPSAIQPTATAEIKEEVTPTAEVKTEEVKETSKKLHEIAKQTPVKITPEGKIVGGNIKMLSEAQKADKKENVTNPSRISFLPNIITLKHLTRSKKDKESILRNGFNESKVNIDSPVPGIYFSSEDWSTMDRFNREKENSLFVEIDNNGLLYFDSSSDFKDYLKNNNLPYSGETLSDVQLNELRQKGVKGIILREDYASQSKNELIVIDKSIIKNVTESTKEITNLPSSFSDFDSISKAYHEAKNKGDNPNFVKAIDNILNEKQVTPTKPVTKTEEKVTEPTAEAAPETKQPTKEAQVAKNMADILRKAKIKMEGGTAMASILPGFEAVWNTTINTVAKAIEVGGVTAGNFRQSIEAGMKALKQSDAYKAITDRTQRAKISARYKKILTSAYAEGYNIDVDKLRDPEFEAFNQKLEGNKGKKLSAKELNSLKAEAKKFVNDNLPTDSYRKSEVLSYVRNNFDKAKTIEDIQKNLEKVNGIISTKEIKIEEQADKKAKKDKETLIKEIINKVKANSKKLISTNRRTGRKTGKISLPAQRKISELHKQGVFDNLEAMTQEELEVLNDNIDSILTTGRSDQKFNEIAEDNSKRAVNGTVLKELGGKPIILNGEQEILDKFDDKNGVVVINGYSMNKSRFETYVKNNPNADLSNVEFYINEQSNVENLKSKTQGPLRKAKRSTLSAIRDLETAVKLIGKGSAKMRAWLEDKIMKPIREAEYKKQDYIFRTISEYNKKKKDIFGIAEGRYTLNNSSGISAGETSLKGREADELTNAQVVHYYGLINNKDAEKRKSNIEILKRQNGINPQEIIDYMNDPKNKKLMDYYDLLNDMYNGDLADRFIPIIESLYNIEIEKGNYWPEPKSGAATDPGSILDLESGNSSNISAIAPQMMHRSDAKSHPFEAVSADEMFHRYIESMAHAEQFIPVVKNVYSLLSRDNVPHIINKLNDINRYNAFITDLGIVLTDKSPFQNDFVSRMANANAVTTLLLRFKSISQQAVSALNYYTAGIKDGVYPHDILMSALPVSKEERAFMKDFFLDNSYLWTRISGGMSTQDTQALKVGIDKFLESKVLNGATNKVHSNVNQAIKDLTKLATNASMSFIKLGDFIAITAPGGGGSFALAQFRNNVANGQDFETAKENAMQRWFEETERTQQPSIARETLSNATYQSTYRFLFPYLSANNAMVKKISKGLIDISDWKNLNNNERAQAISDVIYYTLFAGVPFGLISTGGIVAWLRYNDDDEEESNIKKNRILYDSFADNIQSNMGTLGLSGLISKMALNTLRGREFYNNIPVFQRMADIANVAVGLYNTEGDISKLDKQELNDFWKGWEPTEFEMRKMKKMTPAERDQYFKDNPFAQKKFYKEVSEEYENLNIFEKMGGDSKKSLNRILGKDNFDEMVESFGALVQGDADLNEVMLQIKSRDKDFYFKDKKPDKFYNDNISPYLGEIKEEKTKKSRGGSSSRPGSFPKPKFGPKIPKF